MAHGLGFMAHGSWLMAQPGEYYTTSNEGSYSPGNTPVKLFSKDKLALESGENRLVPNPSYIPPFNAVAGTL
jgi:hypothetical protein